MKHVKYCTLTYQRGSRQVLAASKRQGTLPSTSAQPLDKGKKIVEEEEEDREKEREFELIHIYSDDENETRISNSLLQDRNAQIKEMEAKLEREKDVIHFYQMQNKQMSVQQAIHETRTLRYWKEAQKAHVKLAEFIGTYEESSDEEGQTRRHRTMGLRKALAKHREEKSTQVEQLSLQELLALEIEHDRESWLESANTHLKAKL